MKNVLLVLALAVLGAACSSPPEPRTVQPPVVEQDRVCFPADSPQMALIKSQSVVEERREMVQFPGRLVWDESRTVRVVAPLSGRISRLLAKPGDQVAQGAPLALVSSSELGQMQGEARRARTDAALAEKNLVRASELHTHGIVSLRDLQNAQAESERANAERARTFMRLKLYGASDEITQVFVLRSPIEGAVIERNANPGQEVRPDQPQPGTPALFLVSDPRRLWVHVDVPEVALATLRVGTTLRLRSPFSMNGTFPARVEHVSDFVDPQSRTVRLRASVDNRERLLKAEGFVTAEAEIDRSAFVKVPATAVLLNGDERYVFVDESEGCFRRMRVHAQEAGFGAMRVQKGLASDQPVVVEGALLLQQIFRAAQR